MKRWFAIVLGSGELCIAYVIGGSEAVVMTLGPVLLGVMCIWFSDGLADILGRDRLTGRSRMSVPPFIVSVMGWALLCLPAVRWIIVRLIGS